MVKSRDNVTPVPEWLRDEYPYQPSVFNTPRGAKMSYIDVGLRTDTAVLMLHGNPTWSFYYRHVVAALSATRRCIVPDHFGMGLSAKPQNYPYTLATRISDIEALVRSLRLTQVDLLVHDWGGAVGFGFAARHPKSVGKIAILNTAAFAMNRIPARIALCKLPALGPAIVRGLNGFAGPATWMSMSRRSLTPLEKRAYLFPYDSWAHRVAISAFVEDIPMQPEHPSWPTLAATEQGLSRLRDRPSVIVWGGRDFCFNDAFLDRWHHLMPNAAITRIADAGHYVLEDAREEVVPILGHFLA
jgi:haloalkane dehalogenase